MQKTLKLTEDLSVMSLGVIRTWLAEKFDPGNYPEAIMLSRDLFGHLTADETDELLSTFRRDLELKDVQVFVKPTHARFDPEKTVTAMWFTSLHEEVHDLHEKIRSLEGYIKDKTKVWEEAERIRQIYHGKAALRIDAVIPAGVTSVQVVNAEEIGLDEQAISALLARIRNDSRGLSITLTADVRADGDGYNHALMEAIKMVSGPLGELIGDRVRDIIQKFLQEYRLVLNRVDHPRLAPAGNPSQGATRPDGDYPGGD